MLTFLSNNLSEPAGSRILRDERRITNAMVKRPGCKILRTINLILERGFCESTGRENFDEG